MHQTRGGRSANGVRAALLITGLVAWGASAQPTEEDAGSAAEEVAPSGTEVDAGTATADTPPPPPTEQNATASTEASDALDLAQLLQEPVVSAASRTAESASDAPATTWVISGTDLKRYGIQSVEEAIRYLGHGMTSFEFDDRLNAAFGARGYLSTNLGLHLAVLIDGNQAGGSTMTARGAQRYLMPIELVDHLEVIIGPGSVIYGNSAMLGVINVVTRSPESLDRAHLVAQASAGTPGDKWAPNVSWGEAWGRLAGYGGTVFALGGDPFKLVWHAAFRADRQQGRSVWHANDSVDPYVDPYGAWEREDVFNRDLYSRLFARATWGKWSFMGWAAYSQGKGTGAVEGRGDSTYFEPEYGLDATWKTTIGDRGDLSLRGYAVVFDSRVRAVPLNGDTQHCMDAVGASACDDVINYLAFKPYFEPVFAWDWNQDGSRVTTVGAQLFVEGSLITTGEVEHDGSKSKLDEPILAPLPNVAAYAQHIWRGGFGTLNLGLRGDLGILGSALSPRAAYITSPWENGTLKFIFSTGFRTPVITERYLEIEGFLTSNENIKPERVYSAEVDVAQKLGAQTVQVSVYGAYWDQMINVRGVSVNGERLNQFANVYKVWSAGVNAAWQGSSGPLDWGVSLNYAPGRRELPAGIAQFTDEQLDDARVSRIAIDRYGQKLFGRWFLPAEAMPDGYATAHVSTSLGDKLPRLSVATHVESPRLRTNYQNTSRLLDERNVDGPELPWTLDVRAAVEQELSDRLALRLIGTARTVGTAPADNRIGDLTAISPRGGVGSSSNPIAPLSAMLELDFRL